ncbi:hypothetical protein RM96_29815 [Cupriavidus sp. IDO]|nr:hypothetical protein RM96_29815 [Cupriavidus sp. IDO]
MARRLTFLAAIVKAVCRPSFLQTLALSPALSRKRERGRACGICQCIAMRQRFPLSRELANGRK